MSSSMMATKEIALLTLLLELSVAFQPQSPAKLLATSSLQQKSKRLCPAFVSIGLGPEEITKEEKELVAGVDYEIPNHEEYRTSRRSKLDEQCDVWFGSLLKHDSSNSSDNIYGCLGDLASNAMTILTTPVPLTNEKELPMDDPDYTPFVTTRLPWTPLVPAYGLEEFGLPVPRRNAETWRHFDVTGMVQQDYSAEQPRGSTCSLSDKQTEQYEASLKASGVWLDDDACEARLVYVDGKFCAELSKTTEWAYNLESRDHVPEDAVGYLSRLTDGFTDELAVPVPCYKDMLTSYKNLSKPNHNMGDPTSQFAINVQQGTACFAALNTIKTQSVAYVKAPANHNGDLHEDVHPKPILIVNGATRTGGVATLQEGQGGAAYHPRTLVVAQDGSRISLVQSCVDLDSLTAGHPTLYNGYTQVFVQGTGNVTHTYLEETGGKVTAAVEKSDDEFAQGEPLPREVEAARPALKDTHLETIDVHVMGEGGGYQGTVMSLGGSGRVRIALSVSLLRSRAHASIKGFSLSGGAQRTDMKTNIHHIAQGTTSEQIQKNMIGGRATGAFRGRIRVEQSAQQTNSKQLSRSILLSDKSRAWAIPTLEIVADDIQCTHGATVSDLSDEELFYLRSRGLDRATARNLLMYGFADDITKSVNPAMVGTLDSRVGLQKRVIDRLQNLVPQGERAIKGEFHSI